MPPKHYLPLHMCLRRMLYNMPMPPNLSASFTSTALAKHVCQYQCRQSNGCRLAICIQRILYDSANATKAFPLFYLYRFDKPFRPMQMPQKHWLTFKLCVSGQRWTTKPVLNHWEQFITFIQSTNMQNREFAQSSGCPGSFSWITKYKMHYNNKISTSHVKEFIQCRLVLQSVRDFQGQHLLTHPLTQV